MEITGQIIEIIYQNEINGYTISEFKTEEELITTVGYLPFINKGDSLKLIGKFVNHQEYGEQFKIETFEKIMPQTLEALERYLAGGIIKGIGPATAKKIIEKFGETTIEIFKTDPLKLAKVKGITAEKAIDIAEQFNEKWELWQIVGFLEKFGIGAQNCKKVYEKLGVNAIKEIESNPYILLDITYGVDFAKIDKMAIDLGFAQNDANRIGSAIKYSLGLASMNGNTCVEKQKLIDFIKQLLGVETVDVEEGIINLKAQNKIMVEEREETWVFLDTFYVCEQNIAEKLIALRDSQNVKKIKNFKSTFKSLQEKEEIQLSEKQQEAIEAVNDNNVCVITGGPGTGKTTIIKFIIDMYKMHGKKVVLCAPTGRAAKRMSEATGEEATTIHRLLAIGKTEETLDIERLDYQSVPIDGDVVIIDELSMVDVFIMNYTLKAIYLGTKLILVGDINQLPSVGPGNILKDIINSKQIKTIELNEIFRQAAKSQIITNAHRVNSGENFLIENNKEKLQDFFYINENSSTKMLEDIISLCSGRLQNYGDYDFFKNIQVLSSTKKGPLGTKALNDALQKALNKTKKEGKTHGDRTFKKGDKIMQVKNNYDIFWEREQNDIGTGIFNGELGTILKIEEEDKQIHIQFDDGRKVWYAYNDLDQIEHAYAITIHKSQRKRVRCGGALFTTSAIDAAHKEPALYRDNKSKKTISCFRPKKCNRFYGK